MAINEFNKLSIHVNTPGMYTTIQDEGRVGFQQYGMPVAGPMDSESYLLGQALVGNVEAAGALECTFPAVLANVACACTFLSLEVSTCQASTAVYRPIQRRKLGALRGDHYKRAMNLASNRSPEMTRMSAITVAKGILYSIPPYITVGAVNVMNHYALY